MPQIPARSFISIICSLFFTLTCFGSPVKVPFELHNDHIYLWTMVNGQGPYYFLFDTGAGASGSMIDGDLGERLKLPVEGDLNASMIGGSRGISFTGPVTYQILAMPRASPPSSAR